MDWLARLYARRIINVNVNIIVAGALALGFTVVVMTLIGRAGLDERIHTASGLSGKFIVGGLTFIVDLVADVAVYFLLHWLANHLPRKGANLINPAYAKMTFLEDAGRVQVQRACLSPVLYVIALGGQHALLHLEYSIAASTTIGFVSGITVTRILHTAWMWLEERHLAKAQRVPMTNTHTATTEQRPAA
jgi:hypothetical protein